MYSSQVFVGLIFKSAMWW